MTERAEGVGIGYRAQLAAALLGSPQVVDFVEVVAESCRDRRTLREVQALSSIWPVIPHGVKLSLGSAEGIDVDRARFLGRLARQLRAPAVSEHVSFVRAGGREIGHLTELPFTREAAAVLARNVDRLRRELPDVPLLLENVARGFLWRGVDGALDEGDFHAEVVARTGCGLLLDVGNLYANAVNAGRDPVELLGRYPLDAVAMVHVAGGARQHGFYYDTHAHPVPDEVFGLVERVLAARPSVPVLLERDGAFDDAPAVLAEVARLRAIARRRASPRAQALPAAPRAAPALDAAARAALADAQAEVARTLTSDAPSDDAAVLRARGVLLRKRADDALPLLPLLSSRLTPDDALELGALGDAPRLPKLTAIADAMRIARAARDRPALARAALRDELVLRARWGGDAAAPAVRAAPFVGRAVLDDGRAVWTVKGFGRDAAIRLIETGARR